MTETVALYGFGSFFSKAASKPRDIDILIVHERIDTASINFAIRCKAILRDFLPAAHFTVLSKSEELELDFIQRCHATMLERVTEIGTEADLRDLAHSFSRAIRRPLCGLKEKYDPTHRPLSSSSKVPDVHT